MDLGGDHRGRVGISPDEPRPAPRRDRSERTVAPFARPRLGVAPLAVGSGASRSRALQQLGGRREPSALGPGRPGGRIPQQGGADQELRRYVLFAAQPGLEVAPPGLEGIGPAANDEAVGPDLGDGHLGPESVVADLAHGHRRPGLVTEVGVGDLGGDPVGPVDEHIGLDRHPVAHGDLRWPGAPVHVGADGGEHGALAPRGRERDGGLGRHLKGVHEMNRPRPHHEPRTRNHCDPTFL